MQQTHANFRQQLSAFLDQELPSDQTLFLQRRLEHDASLASVQNRWLQYREILSALPKDKQARLVAESLGVAHVGNKDFDPLPLACATSVQMVRVVRRSWVVGLCACASLCIPLSTAPFLAQKDFTQAMVASVAPDPHAQIAMQNIFTTKRLASCSNSSGAIAGPKSSCRWLVPSGITTQKPASETLSSVTTLPVARPWPKYPALSRSTFNASYDVGGNASIFEAGGHQVAPEQDNLSEFTDSLDSKPLK